ncbi:MAG: hypothetical protein WCC87_11745 [Candidatus Korobacteraceae bacterium]
MSRLLSIGILVGVWGLGVLVPPKSFGLRIVVAKEGRPATNPGIISVLDETQEIGRSRGMQAALPHHLFQNPQAHRVRLLVKHNHPFLVLSGLDGENAHRVATLAVGRKFWEQFAVNYVNVGNRQIAVRDVRLSPTHIGNDVLNLPLHVILDGSAAFSLDIFSGNQAYTANHKLWPMRQNDIVSGGLSTILSSFRSPGCFHRLLVNFLKGTNRDGNADYANQCQNELRQVLSRKQDVEVRIRFILAPVGILGGFFWLLLLNPNKRLAWAVCYWFVGIALLFIGFAAGLFPLYHRADEDDGHNKASHVKIVTQKLLTSWNYRNTLILMANVLSTDKQIAAISALTEGSSIRSIERMTGVHRDTIMRLGVRVGQGCARLMDAKMRDLPCTRLEMDEIWGFVGKKERNVRLDERAPVGNVWTFCAIDADTKLVPAFKVGDRSIATAKAFVSDVASRMRNRVQISTDGLRAYVEAVESAFGSEVDYAQIVKTYGHEEASDNRHYSAPDFVSSEKRVITGNPDQRLISTSYVERLNATTRLHMRRLTRLTLAFSKKRENFEAAVALHFAYYNFVKRHNTLRCTPAMAAGVERNFWTVGDLLEATA